MVNAPKVAVLERLIAAPGVAGATADAAAGQVAAY
jgi:hypothetical protein